MDTTVLPLLFLGLLVFQLDRMNLASALTDGFARDVGIDQNTVNLGNQLMFLGIVVLEIPSNIILQRVSLRLSTNSTSMTYRYTDWTEKMDLCSGLHLWHGGHVTSFRQEQDWIFGIPSFPWSLRGRIYSRWHIYFVYMVHEKRTRKTCGGLLLRNVWWQRNQSTPRKWYPQIGRSWRYERLAMALPPYVIQFEPS